MKRRVTWSIMFLGAFALGAAGCGSEQANGDGTTDPAAEDGPTEGTDGIDEIGPEIPDADVDAEECRADQMRCGAECCDPGLLCTATGGCCDAGRVCAGDCCDSTEECVLGVCLTVCPSGVRCGADFSECCAGGEVCSGDCVEPGDACDFSFDCPEGFRCESTLGRCLPVPAVLCEYFPPTGVFNPVPEWTWEGSTTDADSDQSVVTPLVVQLTDDNGDTVIDRHDVPDVVFTSYQSGGNGRGRLRAASGDGAGELWTASQTVCAYTGLAAGDLDADGLIEIVTAAEGATGGCRHDDVNLQLLAFDHTGELEWSSHDDGGSPVLFDMDLGGTASIADLEGDGFAEVVVAGAVVDHDGTVRWVQALNFANNYSPGTSMPAVADVDDDGEMEIVGGNRVYNADGSTLWSDAAASDGFPAVASFFESGRPEIVVVSYSNVRIVNAVDGSLLWGPTAIPGGGNGGAPTVADFDGDGSVEFGVAGLTSYTVFDPHEASGVLWSRETYENAASVTGSSVFDFENDGMAEVVYADECFLRVYDGITGDEIFKRSSTSGTHLENPVVADVDNDGNAEIVVVSSLYYDPRGRCEDLYTDFTGYTHGVTVYGDELDNWVATRRIWNQHAYHITNIHEDGSVPAPERDSWTWFNSYRLNAQDSASYAPDLLPVDFRAGYDDCPGTITLTARVANNGSAGIPAGLAVSFYRGTPSDPGDLLGTARTTEILLPGSSVWLEVDFTPAPDDLPPYDFFVRVDDAGDGEGRHNECDEDNNTAVIEDIECPVVI